MKKTYKSCSFRGRCWSAIQWLVKPVQRLLAPGTAAGATVDTSTWPEGLYVVTGRNLTGAFQRHNVQIQR